MRPRQPKPEPLLSVSTESPRQCAGVFCCAQARFSGPARRAIVRYPLVQSTQIEIVYIEGISRMRFYRKTLFVIGLVLVGGVGSNLYAAGCILWVAPGVCGVEEKRKPVYKTPPAPNALQSYVAVATSADGAKIASSFGKYKSEAGAIKDSIYFCQKNYGKDVGCKYLHWAMNACVSVAEPVKWKSTSRQSATWAPTVKAAIEKTLSVCTNANGSTCMHRATYCSDGTTDTRRVEKSSLNKIPEPSRPKQRWMVVQSPDGSLNLRTKPNLGNSLIQTALPNGMRVSVAACGIIDGSREWCRVSVKALTGFVVRKYLKE